MFRFIPPFLSFLVFFWTAAPTHADEIGLPAIVKQGAPVEALMDDPIAPPAVAATRLDSGSGTLQRSLSDELPVPVTGTRLPGNLAQFRGLGRSAEDTDVQALGVPLNPPQGGGFDLAVFPQYLWSEYRYHLGPSFGSFDPRATAGSLVLVPWTEAALAAPTRQARATELYSDANLNQVSVAAQEGGYAAALAGYSSGDARGPGGALAARWSLGASTWTFHLLASDIDAKTPGIPSFPTPEAHQETVRAIPVLQADVPVGSEGLLKSSVFYDFEYLRYDSSASALPSTQDRILGYGTENALLWGDWRLGLSARQAQYTTLSFPEQDEAVLNVQAGRALDLAGLVAEPTLRGVAVSRYGLLPEGSFGLRRESRGPEGAMDAWFARLSYSRHFPSLQNRFYSYPGFPGFPGFQANPALSPEEDATLVAGGELKRARWHAGVQLLLQAAQDAQVRAPLDAVNDTEVNAGTAEEAALTPRAGWRPFGWLDLDASMTLAASRVTQTGMAFPGLPAWIGLFSATVHDSRENRRWEGRAAARLSSSATADLSGALLPPYGTLDLDGRYRISRNLSVAASLEDVFDQQIFLVRYFPSVGRTFSALLVGEL